MNRVENPIHILSRVDNCDFAEQWYEMAQEDHFWMQWRFKVFQNFIRSIALSSQEPLRGLEVGCGNGIFRRQIEKHTAWAVDGAELHLKSLQLNEKGRGELYFYNILEKTETLRERYDFLVLFDVLEHIQETRPFLEACVFHLKPQGYLFVNVPALQAMFGKYDEVVGHHRRYNKKSLAGEFRDFDIELIDLQYWGLSMVPLLFVRKALNRMAKSPDNIVQQGFQPPGKFVHACLKLVMRAETFLLQRPPLGTSLMGILRKR